MEKKLTVKATTPSRPQITEKFLQVLFDCRQESRFLQKAYVIILDFDSFLLRLNEINILRHIAFRSNRLEQFKKTWAKLL